MSSEDQSNPQDAQQAFQVEIAGTVIMLTPQDAALVIYADKSLRGCKVTLYDDVIGCKFSETMGSDRIEASFMERSVGGTVICAAIFPRLKFPFRCSMIKVHLLCHLPYRKIGNWQVTDNLLDDLMQSAYPILYPGNVTEVDWRDIPDRKGY